MPERTGSHGESRHAGGGADHYVQGRESAGHAADRPTSLLKWWSISELGIDYPLELCESLVLPTSPSQITERVRRGTQGSNIPHAVGASDGASPTEALLAMFEVRATSKAPVVSRVQAAPQDVSESYVLARVSGA